MQPLEGIKVLDLSRTVADPFCTMMLGDGSRCDYRGTAVCGVYNIGRIGAAMAPMIIGIIAESRSIGFGLATLGIAYALAGIIPAIFIKEKMYDPFTNEENNLKSSEKRTTNYTA